MSATDLLLPLTTPRMALDAASCSGFFGTVDTIQCKGGIKTDMMECKRDVRGLVWCKQLKCWASSNCDTCLNNKKMKLDIMNLIQELEKWLIEEVRRRSMLDAGSLSVSVCRSCQKRGIWGGNMGGVRATTCSGCKNETAHDFYPFDLSQNAKAER